MASPPPLMSSAPPPIHHLLCHNSLHTLIIILRACIIILRACIIILRACIIVSALHLYPTQPPPLFRPMFPRSATLLVIILRHHSFISASSFISTDRYFYVLYPFDLVSLYSTDDALHSSFPRHSFVIPSSFLPHSFVITPVPVLHTLIVLMLRSTTPPQRYSSLAFTLS